MYKNIKKITMLLFVAAAMLSTACHKEYASYDTYQELIVGKWSCTMMETNQGQMPMDGQNMAIILEFTSSGNYTETDIVYGEQSVLTGTYKLQGKKLTLTSGGNDYTEEVVTLDQKNLVLKTEYSGQELISYYDRI